MKIGIYDMYLDAMGGGEKYMLSIASMLSKKNSVDIFWDDKDILIKAKKRFSLDYSNIKLVKNIFLSPLSFFEKKKVMASYHVIIYLSDGSIPFLFAKKNIIHFQFPTPWINGKDLLTKLKLKKINTIVCNSEFTKKYIDQSFGLKSKILYPPCSLVTVKEKKENIILTVGRYNKLSEHNDFKKIEKMISIFKARILSDNRGWKFVVVITHFESDTSVIEQWKKDLKDLPIQLITNTDYETLQKLYAKSKIYWHAAGYEEDLDKHPERAEHFGIAPVEAMSAGAVPIVINAGGLPEIVDEGKDGLIWNTEDELVQQTKRIIIDDKFREELSQNAISKSKHFSEEAFQKQLFTLIDSLS